MKNAIAIAVCKLERPAVVVEATLHWSSRDIFISQKRDLKGFKCMTVSLDVSGNFLILFETFKFN